MSLLFDIVANGGFCAMLPNRTYIVPVTPELTAPQLLFYAWHSCKDFACRQALDNADDLGWTIAGHRLNEKMHMIPIRPNFQKHQLVTFGNVQAHRLQCFIHFFTDDDSS